MKTIVQRIGAFLDPRQPMRGDQYALVGLVAFTVKFSLDHAVAKWIFHEPWKLLDYWLPRMNAVYLAGLSDKPFFMWTLVMMSIPFMIFGVLMTRRRLTAIGEPQWVSVLFFVPFLNLVFFAYLCFRDRRPSPPPQPANPPRVLAGWIPCTDVGSGLAAIGISVAFSCAAMGFSFVHLKAYGFALFMFLPFVHGMVAVWIYTFHGARSLGACQKVAFYSSLALALGAVILAMEGMICILMAAPLWSAMAAMGAWVAWELQWRRHYSESGKLLLLLVICTPLLMGAEYRTQLASPLIRVQSVIDIQAPADVVWRHVIAFSELPPPTEWIFRIGVAYPMRAEIQGRGAGAMRHCVFSTGAFVEPIKVWDAPRLLRFGVTASPPPLQEVSPYKHLDPPHLHGYLVSKEGQFLLTPLPSGGTRLEGTTWYTHGLFPAAYWQLWSDQIIHRIHLRVLRHIKGLAEGGR